MTDTTKTKHKKIFLIISTIALLILLCVSASLGVVSLMCAKPQTQSTKPQPLSEKDKQNAKIFKFLLDPNTKTYKITKWYGKTDTSISSDIVIPATYRGVYVTALIDRFIHEGSDRVTSLSFEEGSQFTTINNYAFIGCTNLISVKLPASLKTIGHHAFYDCSKLSEFSIAPNSNLKSIGYDCFVRCNGLTTFNFPKSLTQIQHSAFVDCSNLTTLTFNSTTPPQLVDSQIFNGCTNLTSIFVPAGTAQAYKQAENWSTIANLIKEK